MCKYCKPDKATESYYSGKFSSRPLQEYEEVTETEGGVDTNDITVTIKHYGDKSYIDADYLLKK